MELPANESSELIPNKNRQILDLPLYGKDLKDLFEVTSAGERNLVTVAGMFRTLLFQYDPRPDTHQESAFDEMETKLAYAAELLWKLGSVAPELTLSDVNLLKALCMGMQFQAGSVRYQLLQYLTRFDIADAEIADTPDVPSNS